MPKDPLNHAGKNGSIPMEKPCIGKEWGASLCGEFPLRYSQPTQINRLSCTHQSIPEDQDSKIYENLSKRCIKSNQHMDNPNAFTNDVKTTLFMDSTSQKLTLVISKEKQQNMNPASWKLTGVGKPSLSTHQVDACSCKLTGEENSESTI